MDRLARLGVQDGRRPAAAVARPSWCANWARPAGEHLHRAGVRAATTARCEPERETKSISVEDTFERDIADAGVLGRIAERHARIGGRAAGEGRAVRPHGDREGALARLLLDQPLADAERRHRPAEVVAQVARSLLDGLDTSQGVRLLGVGVSGLVEVAQEPLFDLEASSPGRVVEEAEAPLTRRPAGWLAGSGRGARPARAGWVWGSGLGRVTVRFETADPGPGRCGPSPPTIPS